MKGGAERQKHALVAVIHATMVEINGYKQWDLPARLIASMPRRLAAVRLVEGKQTKYQTYRALTGLQNEPLIINISREMREI